MTVAVDSEAHDRRRRGGGHPRGRSIDVDVGLPRCGCPPAEAGRLADLARRRGLTVRGRHGLRGPPDDGDRPGAQARRRSTAAVDLLLAAHADVGGDIVSSGGTGTFDLHDRVTEVQAGSYALMDTQYATLDFGTLGQPFGLALSVLGTVISVQPAVGRPRRRAEGARAWTTATRRVDGATVWFCSDEHLTFAPDDGSDGSTRSATGSGSGRRTSTRRWPSTSGCTSSTVTGWSTPGRSISGAGDRQPEHGRAYGFDGGQRLGPVGLAGRVAGRGGHGRAGHHPGPRASASSARSPRPEPDAVAAPARLPDRGRGGVEAAARARADRGRDGGGPARPERPQSPSRAAGRTCQPMPPGSLSPSPTCTATTPAPCRGRGGAGPRRRRARPWSS